MQRCVLPAWHLAKFCQASPKRAWGRRALKGARSSKLVAWNENNEPPGYGLDTGNKTYRFRKRQLVRRPGRRAAKVLTTIESFVVRTSIASFPVAEFDDTTRTLLRAGSNLVVNCTPDGRTPPRPSAHNTRTRQPSP
ncbi:hypothetical protein BDZ45DRAFT_93827 [Acephala macrosclerotiorum]|nr:hypothetical protein BDZ45DRAFT_93827 [Acephala macrosclerotiorum]